METNYLNRRDWLKKGTLSLAAMALLPSDIWAMAVEEAQQNNSLFLFNPSNKFNEFTPPVFKENKLKAILRANENPYGPPPMAAKVFQETVFTGNRYAWKSLKDLIGKLAKQENVKPEQILMAPGSSDILEKVAMVLFQKGGNVISADPSYMSLIQVSKSVGGQWKSFKLKDNFEHDLDAMEAAIDSDTKLVYICNPNNPTGTVTNAKKLKEFCSRVSEKVPVFVDEAYIELSKNGLKDSMNSLVSEGKNVIVARTFSKIYGMAGLRIGYMIGKEETVNQIKEITRGGMGITGPSIAAATKSLDEKEFIDMCKTKIASARDYTKKYLESKGYSIMPSETNFMIFEIDMDGKVFLEKIYAKQVGVRAFKFWDKNWCRVSIGTMEEMELFTKAMDEIFA